MYDLLISFCFINCTTLAYDILIMEGFIVSALISKSFQVVYDNVFLLDDEMKWKNLAPMPKPDSHIEFAWALVNNSIVIAGGTTEKHPITKKMVLVGEIFRFDLNTLVIYCLLQISSCWYKDFLQSLFFLFRDVTTAPVRYGEQFLAHSSICRSKGIFYVSSPFFESFNH